MRAFTQQIVILSVFNQIIVIAGNVFSAGDDVFVLHDVVEHDRRIIHDIANDVSVAARVDGLAKAPRFNPSFQLGNRHQRQQGNVRTAALDGIEQGLIFQIADENVFFVFRQVRIVNTVIDSCINNP